MGFEPLDASSLGDFKLEDLAEAPLVSNVNIYPTQEMSSAGKARSYLETNKWYLVAGVIGGAIGYFLYGWGGALIGSVSFFVVSQPLAEWLFSVLFSGVHVGANVG